MLWFLYNLVFIVTRKRLRISIKPVKLHCVGIVKIIQYNFDILLLVFKYGLVNLVKMYTQYDLFAHKTIMLKNIIL